MTLGDTGVSRSPRSKRWAGARVWSHRNAVAATLVGTVGGAENSSPLLSGQGVGRAVLPAEAGAGGPSCRPQPPGPRLSWAEGHMLRVSSTP